MVYGGLKMVFSGVIRYRDIYGKRRFTTFKYFFHPHHNYTDNSFDLLACGRGNNAT